MKDSRNLSMGWRVSGKGVVVECFEPLSMPNHLSILFLIFNVSHLFEVSCLYSSPRLLDASLY